jgi:hypothetical protein
VGENPAAPDITTIVVSNTDTASISLRVNVPNRPTLTQDMLVVLWVDSDNNPATGDPDSLGADYLVLLFRGDIALLRWDGADYVEGSPATSLIFAYAGGAVTFSINAAELGNTRRFGFATRVISGIVIDETTGDLDFTNAVQDDAPSGAGLFNYQLQITPPSLLVAASRRCRRCPRGTDVHDAPRRRPFRHRRNRPERARHVRRSGGHHAPACAGRRSPPARRPLEHPANAKGKTFRGSVTVVFEGLRASSSISRRIASPPSCAGSRSSRSPSSSPHRAPRPVPRDRSRSGSGTGRSPGCRKNAHTVLGIRGDPASARASS